MRISDIKMDLQRFTGAGVKVTTSDDIFIEIDGKRIAGVQDYNMDYGNDTKKHSSFGQNDSIGWSTGEQTYSINLSRIMLEDTAIADGIDFFDLTDTQFDLVIIKNTIRTRYGTCSITTISESASLKDSVRESMTVQALSRTKE